MDLKALIAKMDQIESKQLLNEGFPTVADAKARADKEKTTGKFDKKELSTGTQYTRKASTFDDGGKDKDQKKAEKKKKNEGIDFQSSIAQMLLREFGLEEAEAANPWANDPAKSAAWAALTPQDQKWLGGADPTDPYILARAPNKGKPAAPAAAAPAAPAAAPAVGASAEGNAGEAEAQAAMAAQAKPPAVGASAEGNAGEAEAQAAMAAQAAAPTADPKKIARFKELLAKAAAPAAGGATAPAAGGAAAGGAAKAKPDPKVMALQQELIKKGAKIKADGIMGPQTMAAQKQFGAQASGSPAANPIKNTNANTQGVGGLNVSGSTVGA
jgi:hypothetical protein